ncbi:MAG: hypothetical protein GEU26_16870 [Nitrososphaeraceae archaeon]|nr:hypothetical protein [Nitrososphaeraceae archaeon]
MTTITVEGVTTMIGSATVANRESPGVDELPLPGRINIEDSYDSQNTRSNPIRGVRWDSNS